MNAKSALPDHIDPKNVTPLPLDDQGREDRRLDHVYHPETDEVLHAPGHLPEPSSPFPAHVDPALLEPCKTRGWGHWYYPPTDETFHHPEDPEKYVKVGQKGKGQ